MNVNAVNHIKDVINAEGGVIPFSRFMSLALYHPDFGYYITPHEKFGPKGDFITAPMVSPLYAQTLARSIVDDVTAHPFIMEWGAGNGQLAKDILTYLSEQGLHPHYAIVEVSPACRAMQRETLATFGDQISWIDTPPDSFEGVIIANEVLDALPVDMFHCKNGEMFERNVTWVDNHFEWIDCPVAALVGAPHEAPGDDYISETHVAADELMRVWLSMLKAGKLIIVDYGFLEHEYYHPSRTRGTLMCHYQHTAHDDPFIHVGEQDITAHVNFTRCIDMAVAAGADVTFYTQAQYLMHHGLMDLAQACFTEDIARQRMVSQAIRVLVDPQDMGEMFKVLVICPSIS
jgi:SAM-dependent MidA family methyltransferase